MRRKKSILIIDEHPIFRKGLKIIIELDERFEIVGEAGNGSEGLRMAKELKPDLVTVDLPLTEERKGIQMTREIRFLLPKTHIMVVTMHSNIDYVIESFQAGATGYVVKESGPEIFLKGLESVSKGKYFMDSSVSTWGTEMLMDSVAKGARARDVSRRILTSREEQVIRLLAQGLSTKSIAKRLRISEKTVENHITRSMKKLSVHSSRELIRCAAKLGVINVAQWKG